MTHVPSTPTAPLVTRRFVILTSIGILLAYVGYGAAILLMGDLARSANFGESFGAISGLLNGAGLIAAVVALVLQHNELQETKKEVQVTLEAHRQQAAEATRAADAHEQSVRATRLLATVQALSALMAYYNSLRAAQLAKLETLQRELRDGAEGGRRLKINGELDGIRRRLTDFDNAALDYENQLADALKRSGLQA